MYMYVVIKFSMCHTEVVLGTSLIGTRMYHPAPQSGP